MIPFSILDLAPIIEGGDAALALRNSRDFATHAERWGYHRFWLAEHHNMASVASAATAVMIAHVGQDTKRIRLGSGGIMLPNHAPLQIAEQFGTLEAIFPGRIDIGLGRAPGTDMATARALRRTLAGDESRFPQDVIELQAFLGAPQDGQRVHAVPGENSNIPLWILGSSLFGAQLAAALGLPFAFASHFAPAQMDDAIAIYRARFEPSAQLDKPYVMLAFNMFAADTEAAAHLMASSWKHRFVGFRRGSVGGKLVPPIADFEAQMTPDEHVMITNMMRTTAIGAPDAVRAKLQSFIAELKPDELMLTAHVYDHAARLRSFEIAADIRQSLA